MQVGVRAPQRAASVAVPGPCACSAGHRLNSDCANRLVRPQAAQVAYQGHPHLLALAA